MTPAQKLTKSVRDLLALHGWFSFKVGSGALKVQDRFVRLSSPGAPDLVAVKGDRYLLLELKAGRDKLKPSQIAFAAAVEQVRGRYVVVRNLHDLLLVIDSRQAPEGTRTGIERVRVNDKVERPRT